MRAKEIIEAAEDYPPDDVVEVGFTAGPDGDDMPMSWHHKPPHPTGMWPDRPVDRTWSSLFVTHHHYAGPPFEMKFRMKWNRLYYSEIVNELGLTVWRGSSWTSPIVAEAEGLNAVPEADKARVSAALAVGKWAAVKKAYLKREALAGLA